MNDSIRRRLTREILLAVTLLLCAGATVFYFVLRDEAIDQFDATLRARALAINALADDADDDLRTAAAEHIMLAIEGRKARHFFQITDGAGAEILRSRSLPARTTLPFRDAPMARPAFWNLTLPNGNAGRAISFSTPQGASKTAAQNGAPAAARTLRITLASDREDLDDILRNSLWLFAALGAIFVTATLVLIPRVLRRGLKPLQKLGEDTARIDADSLATRFPVATLPVELRPIADRLNELLARLETSFVRERRFSADLAHELRTPLAELRASAECALKWPESRDPAEVDAGTLAIARQMERIVTDLLALARNEKTLDTARLQPVDLAPFLAETWQAPAARAAARRLAVALPQNNARCLADATLLRSIALNLMENAVTYTPEGGALRIDIATHGARNGGGNGNDRGNAGSVSIIFTNNTDDLTEADIPRLFDRLWRKDPSRTGAAAHTGLGLPLARALAQAMGWTLTAALARAGDGAQIVFTLAGPLAETVSTNAERTPDA